jgi:hypothetical protein
MSNFALQLARRFDPRHLAIALVAIIVSFAFLDFVYKHELDSLVAFHLNDSDPAFRNSFPAVVVGLMFLFAGALAFAIASMRGTGNPGWWRLTAVVLVFFGIEEALGLHTWADRHLGVDWNIVYLPFISIAAIVWFQTASLMKGHRGAQLMFATGLAGWMLAAVFDAARTGRAESLPGGELLEMASAGLLLLGVFTYARASSLAERPAHSSRESTLAIARAAVSRIDIPALVIGIASFIVLFGILGAIVYPGGGDLRAFDLNKEQTFPATFSGVLLLAAGGLALLNGLVRSETASGRRWWIVLALVFAFLGLDEIAALHEAVQDRVHVWGQATLAPIIAAGVYAWWVTLKRLRAEQPVAGALFVLGAAAWIVSQLIDVKLNEPWGWTIVPEELGEMTGSALFGLALLVALRPLLAPEPAPVAQSVRSAAPALEGLPAAH